MKKIDYPFEAIPSYMLQNMIKVLDMKPIEFTVYLYLVGKINRDKKNQNIGWTWPSQNVIAYYCNISRSSVTRAINSLIEKKIITNIQRMVHEDGSFGNNRYKILTPEELYKNPEYMDKVKITLDKKMRIQQKMEKRQQELLDDAERLANSDGEDWKDEIDGSEG